MMSDDEFMPVELTVAAMLGLVDIDPHLIPCPRCGNHLRSEVRTCWLSIAEASEASGIQLTPQMIRDAGGKLDTFGRVKSGVPFVTCMHCGFDANAAEDGFVDG